ncbi:hypothetical protein K1719_033723 [Acacia pycnantha]|nr:hypothetical protein K1719_033723 [Acacia pycnantha]
MFSFEETEKERLLKPFRRTLIVKLMGRQPSFGFMMKKMRQIWERKGKIDVFDLENDFYLINFQHFDDYMEALTGGPWVISDAYLSVSRWRPEFSPKSEKINSVVAWVRFPDLPAPLFDKKFLLNLGNSIGKAIRLDVHTAQRARGKFARMCVELDLTKPLVPEFSVEGQVLSVVYESLGQLCTKCGRVGHMRDSCDKTLNKQKADGMEVEEQQEIQKTEENRGEPREIWKTVQRTRRPRRIPMQFQNQNSGSRFEVLQGEVIEEEQRGNFGATQGQTNEVPMRGEEKAKGQHRQMSRQRGSNVGEVQREAGVQKNKSVEKVTPVRQNEKEGRKKYGILAERNMEVLSSRPVKQGSSHNSGMVIEPIPEKIKVKSVNMTEKENLHPGEYMESELENTSMDTGKSIASGAEANAIERPDRSGEDVPPTVLLAN